MSFPLPPQTIAIIQMNDPLITHVTSLHQWTTPSMLHVNDFSCNTINIPMEQVKAIEQSYHNIVDNYCVPDIDSVEMIYSQPASLPDSLDNQNTISASNNSLPALQDNVQLNFAMHNESGITNLVMFHIEANGCGQKEVLAMVEKYLEPLTVCYNMGWQRHSLGTSYNSMSGHAFLVGANSNKLWKRIIYSKSCCTCTWQLKKKGAASLDGVGATDPADTSNEVLGELPMDHQDHCCSMNFRGSSKSMEPHGAVACVTALFNTGIAYIFEIVGDDDSSISEPLTLIPSTH